MRKTLDRQAVVDIANQILALPSASDDTRCAVACYLERMLHDNESYAGFQYLPDSTRAWQKSGNLLTDDNGDWLPDDYRRRYF